MIDKVPEKPFEIIESQAFPGEPSQASAVSRRDFLRRAASCSCALYLLSALPPLRGVASSLLSPRSALAEEATTPQHAVAEKSDKYVAPARYVEKLPELKIRCKLCPRECAVADRERGHCGVRENRGGDYYTLVYSRPCSVASDPIEKKPLFHFLPGTTAFSLATAGCNIECKFCQNWQISQFLPEQVRSVYLPPDEIVSLAITNKDKTIAYTYSEPVVFYEYMYDIAKAGRSRGVRSVAISNGFIQEKPLRDLCKQLDAIKIDFKAFTEKFYRETCSGELKPVLHTLEVLKDIGIWFELVVLLVPTLNDSENEIREKTKWVVKNLSANVPMHFTRFHPTYKIKNLPVTPTKTLEMAHNVAVAEGVKFAYVGNVPGHQWESTYCPKCKEKVIARYGYYIQFNNITAKGACPKCGEKIPGVWT
jgi:pyruvate formate lyase activating enzyme